MTQVSSNYYFNKKYLSLERFISYFYQLDAIQKSSPRDLLFVGVGDNLMPYLLKQNKEYKVTTLDFDTNLKPDIVGDVRQLPFPDKSFDIVTCTHTIEHIINLKQAIDELKRVARKQLIIVTPCQRYNF